MRVEQLLAFPDDHPYHKWTGTHWRLVEIADSDVPVERERLDGAVRSELAWLLPGLDPEAVLRLSGRARRHGSIEGNAVYALCRLGFVDHPGTRQLVEALLDWQWPDGGWNCDRHRRCLALVVPRVGHPGVGPVRPTRRLTGDARSTAHAARADR